MALHLDGLLPPRISTLAAEVARVQLALKRCTTVLDRYQLLMAVKERSSSVFFATLAADVEHLLPVVYTPGVRCYPPTGTQA